MRRASPDSAAVGAPSNYSLGRGLRWTVCGILTVALWLLLVQLPLPPKGDLDSAWSMVLVYVHRHGLQLGPEIAFTYGPLGFLMAKVSYDGIATVRLLWETVGKFAFALTAVGIGASFGWRRFVPYYIGLVLAAILSPDLCTSYGVPLLALCWLFPVQTKRWQLVLAIGWMAFFSAVRFNYWLLAVFAVALASLLYLLRGEWKKAVALSAGYLLAFVAVWMLAGQAITHLPRYLADSWDISQGYSAMSVDELFPSSWRIAITLWVLLALFAITQLWKRRRRETIMLCYFGLTWFFLWKHGFTRADEGHITLFFPEALVLLAIAPAAFGARKHWTFLDPAPALCFLGLCLCRPDFVPLTPGRLLHRLHAAPGEIFRPERQAKRFAAGERKDLQLHGRPELRSLVGDSTIDVLSYNQEEVLRERLHYHPRPVFQSYTAYTPNLLRRNQHFYESDDAPQFAFARLQTIDGRYPAQDDSLVLEELPRRYAVAYRGSDYLLLQRRGEQPHAELRRESLGSRAVRFHERIDLPEAKGAAIEMRARFKPTLAGALRAFLVQPPQVAIVLVDRENREHRGRLIPAMAETGFLVQPLLETPADFSSFLDGRASASIRSIRFEPERKTARRWSSITVEFFRVPELSAPTLPNE